MRRPRHVPSTVDRLDPEIRKLISDLRIEHGWTIDQIREKLDELGKPVSRSALGRHVRSLPEVAQQIRESRDMAEALAREVGNAGEDKLAELNIELMHGVVLRLLSSAQRGDDGPEAVQFEPEDVMFLASSLQKLSSARKTDVDRVQKMVKLAEDRAKQDALKKVEEVARTHKGLTADTVAAIRHAVLGDA